MSCLASLTLAGCMTTTDRGSWGSRAHWPTAAHFKDAAVDAAREPMTWIPLASAAALGITGLDKDLSKWAADHQPVFGKNANDTSDTLRNLSTIAYATTALLAPNPSLTDKAKGFAVGISAMTLSDGITQAGKSLTKRERPNGQNNSSFPSGHASGAAVRTTLAAANVDYMPLPNWANTSLKVGLYGMAGATAWARVEAEKHHVTDVLVGYALGHFVARLMHGAFLEAGNDNLAISLVPQPNGAALRFHFTPTPR
jgi:hypothetical protein